MILLKTKVSLIVIAIFCFACENKKPQKKVTQDAEIAQVDSQVVEEKVEPVYQTNKSPCEGQKPVHAAYKSEDTNGFYLEVTPICLEDYGVIDTAFGNGDTTPIMISSNYRHKVELFLRDDSAEYFISKDNITFSEGMHNQVLVRPDIKGFTQADTTAYVNFFLGRPDTDDLIICKFKISYNNGVKHLGYEEPEFDPLLDE